VARLDVAFGLDPIPPTELAARLKIDQKWIDRGVQVVSLLLAPNDRSELEGNPRRRGREWERTAYMSVIERQEVRFASRVGVRLHGGRGRDHGRFSYRIYFRQGYGRDRFPLELFPTGGQRGAKRILLRPDVALDRGGLDFHFLNAITSDIARRIGLPYVHSQPAAIFINGEYYGVRSVTERIDKHYAASHFELSSIVLARMKRTLPISQPRVRQGPKEPFFALESWATGKVPPTLPQARERVDLDNLMRWVLLVQIAGIDDHRQGTALLDLAEPEARWFWVPWDFDLSLGVSSRKPQKGRGYAVNLFRPYFLAPRWREEMRGALNGRLLAASPEYRSGLMNLFDEIWNHLLTPAFRQELIQKYRDRCRAFGLDEEYLNVVHRFLDKRASVLRRQLRRHYGFGSSHSVEIRAPRGTTLMVDGYDHGAVYSGKYFEGSILRVGVRSATEVLHWEVDGRLTEARELEFEVRAPHRIRLISG
jgi:hypothetical protein